MPTIKPEGPRNDQGIVPDYCFLGGEYEIDGPGTAHEGNKYFPYGEVQERATECPYGHDFGCND